MRKTTKKPKVKRDAPAPQRTHEEINAVRRENYRIKKAVDDIAKRFPSMADTIDRHRDWFEQHTRQLRPEQSNLYTREFEIRSELIAGEFFLASWIYKQRDAATYRYHRREFFVCMDIESAIVVVLRVNDDHAKRNFTNDESGALKLLHKAARDDVYMNGRDIDRGFVQVRGRRLKGKVAK